MKTFGQGSWCEIWVSFVSRDEHVCLWERIRMLWKYLNGAVTMSTGR